MHVDVLIDPFDGRWEDLRDAALLAESSGIDGLWMYDHLAGSVHRAGHVLECWTTLSALAGAVPRLMLGPLVLNVANRDAGTLAVMAATFQEVSSGRLLLGVGAGGGPGTPYAAEQHGLGREVPGDRRRRSDVADTVATLRSVWTGEVGGVRGYLRPDPAPPVIVGGFGPKMAELAGRIGDGINCPPSRLGQLVPIARDAQAAAGGDPGAFVVTTSANPTGSDLARLHAAGVDHAIVMIRPPYLASTERLVAALGSR
jgi:alkanesulfonate monooxygenase SsuD/methylene tetrahydromethanopterin reductase-like flavin-dependent oxidoreductase (luciferase family)